MQIYYAILSHAKCFLGSSYEIGFPCKKSKKIWMMSRLCHPYVMNSSLLPMCDILYDYHDTRLILK